MNGSYRGGKCLWKENMHDILSMYNCMYQEIENNVNNI